MPRAAPPRYAPAALLPCLCLLCACGPRAEQPLQGYVEGEYVRVAAPFAGTLQELSVQRGGEGQRLPEVIPETWPIALFGVVVIAIGLRTFRSTLD